MDARLSSALQKLAPQLGAKEYNAVAEVLMHEFLIPQPSIAQSIKAISPITPTAPAARRGRPHKKHRVVVAGEPAVEGSKAGAVRELLASGPKTTTEIVATAGVDPKHIHPLLASIGAKPVGTVTDAEGDERKVYGIPG